MSHCRHHAAAKNHPSHKFSPESREQAQTKIQQRAQYSSAALPTAIHPSRLSVWSLSPWIAPACSDVCLLRDVHRSSQPCLLDTNTSTCDRFDWVDVRIDGSVHGLTFGARAGGWAVQTRGVRCTTINGLRAHTLRHARGGTRGGGIAIEKHLDGIAFSTGSFVGDLIGWDRIYLRESRGWGLVVLPRPNHETRRTSQLNSWLKHMTNPSV